MSQGHWIKVAIDAAYAAGRLLCEDRDWHVNDDTGRDTKSSADEAAETLIRRFLSPIAPVLGEEQGGKFLENDPFWIIDPIDGTVNFHRGIPLGCISIALWDKGPKMGVVYDFYRGELFYGVVGEGAFLNGMPSFVSKISHRHSAVIFTGFPISSNFDDNSINHYTNKVKDFKKVRLLGSAALSLAYVASGRGDYYEENSIKIWDTAAGMALVKAAGGFVSYTSGIVCDVVAHNGLLKPSQSSA